uniref:Uncharacterized protein n=1 Tax=Oryza meridionalis TaxID=40149 RepID=A0A0E0EL16_9ORYZ
MAKGDTGGELRRAARSGRHRRRLSGDGPRHRRGRRASPRRCDAGDGDGKGLEWREQRWVTAGGRWEAAALGFVWICRRLYVIYGVHVHCWFIYLFTELCCWWYCCLSRYLTYSPWNPTS